MAIAHQQTVSAEVSPGTSVTYTNFAVGAGSDRTLVVCVGFSDIGQNDTVVSSVVFNGTETFTKRESAYQHPGGSSTIGAEVWTLDDPSNTTANVVVTMNQSVDNGLGMTVSEYTGANNGIGNTGSATGKTKNPTVTFTTTDSSSVIVAGVGHYDPTDDDYTPGTNTIERLEDHVHQTSYLCLEEDATGGSDTIDCTSGASADRDWGMAAIELLEASGGVTVSPGAAISEASAVNPSVVLGSMSITPSVAEALAEGVDPAVILGSIIMTPGVAQAEGSAVDPTVQAGGDIFLTPDQAQAVASAIDPAIVLGSTSVTPAQAIALALAMDPKVLEGEPELQLWVALNLLTLGVGGRRE